MTQRFRRRGVSGGHRGNSEMQERMGPGGGSRCWGAGVVSELCKDLCVGWRRRLWVRRGGLGSPGTSLVSLLPGPEQALPKYLKFPPLGVSATEVLIYLPLLSPRKTFQGQEGTEGAEARGHLHPSWYLGARKTNITPPPKFRTWECLLLGCGAEAASVSWPGLPGLCGLF